MWSDRADYEEAVDKMHFKGTDPNAPPDVVEIRKRQRVFTNGKNFYLFVAVVIVASFLAGIYFGGN